MGNAKPTKGRPLAGQSRVEAARSGSSLPIFPIVIGVLVLIVGITLVATRLQSDDGDGGSGVLAAGDQAFGPVEVEGDELPAWPQTGEPEIGMVAPTLVGETPSGEAVTIEPGADGPMVIVFLAHWCPHCQAEVPRLVEAMDDEGRIDGVQAVAVLTSSTDERENFPPGAWLAEEGWTGRVMVDTDPTEEGQPSLPVAGTAYGIGSFPYMVAVDGDGVVTMRTVGEQGDDGIREVFASAA